MTQDLAQKFVNLRRLGLATKPLAELSLDRAESSFDVVALVGFEKKA